MRSTLLLPTLLLALACASQPRPTPADLDAAITRA